MNKENELLFNDVLLIGDFLPEYSNLSLEEITNNFNETNIIGVFAYCIKRVRRNKNLTQKELGELIDISEKTLYNYENGKTKPTKRNKEKILNFLSISENTLYTVQKTLDEFNKSKEFYELKIKEENKEIDNIVEEIRKINHQTLYFIVDFITKKNLLELKELKKVVKGFRMLKATDDFIIAYSNNLDGYDGKIELLKKNNERVTFNIDDFIYFVLIELSETVDNIFYKKRNLEEKSILSYETEMNKIKQYKKLSNLLKNKEGGSDE